MELEEQELIDSVIMAYETHLENPLGTVSHRKAEELLFSVKSYCDQGNTLSVIEHCQKFGFDFSKLKKTDVEMFTYDELCFLRSYAYLAAQIYHKHEDESTSFESELIGIEPVIPELLFIYAALIDIGEKLSPYYVADKETREKEVLDFARIGLLSGPIMSFDSASPNEFCSLNIPGPLFNYLLPVFYQIRKKVHGDWMALMPLRMSELGWVLQSGCKQQGVARDEKKAIQFFESGIIKEFDEYERQSVLPFERVGQNRYQLGRCYEFGIGVEKDAKKAEKYYDDLCNDTGIDVREWSLEERQNVIQIPTRTSQDCNDEIRFFAWRPNGYYPSDNVRALISDEETVDERLRKLCALSYGSVTLMFDCSDELRSNREIVSRVLGIPFQGHAAFQYASEELRSDPEFVLKMVSYKPRAFQYASEDLHDNRDLILQIVNDEYFDGYALNYISEELKNDYDIFIAAVQRVYWTIEFASYELQMNHDIAMAAVKTDGDALSYLPSEIRANREIVMEAVRNDGCALYYASEELKNDRELVMEAVLQDAYALRWASEEMQADYEMVLEAVQRKGYVLEYASDELKANRVIVLAAVNNVPSAIEFASEDLQNDDEVLRVAEERIKEFEELSEETDEESEN